MFAPGMIPIILSARVRRRQEAWDWDHTWGKHFECDEGLMRERRERGEVVKAKPQVKESGGLCSRDLFLQSDFQGWGDWHHTWGKHFECDEGLMRERELR
jgi:hypothetical protein